MKWLLILGALILVLVALYACLIIAGEADRREEALWAQREEQRDTQS